jgi:hypothetical protein
MKIRNLAAAAALALATFSAALPALAAEVTFTIRNNHPNALEVELYSQDRNHVWPGGGEVYVLDDGDAKSMALSCKEGENICYGAWIKGDQETYWGVGPNNAQSCTDCCYTCTGGETETIDLIP